MLSVILYGRNDSHGYNLHKRASLSLNCIAEALTDPDDEIIFVDYNTPIDLPTFPEAIADTLTQACRARLRILRLRPEVHAPFRQRTHLVALESISRNTAIRRANPANRWILSTNTDMVFVARPPWRSLSETVADLPDGYYGLPRFDVPQALWESVDRMDGRGVIAAFGAWGRGFHLNEIVHGDPWILFDAPGDFQLMTRHDIGAIHGFHEGMIHGWHVDSNLCKRMALLRGELRSLDERLIGYHCDHSRQATLASQSNKVENSIKTFFEDVDTPFIPEQADSWGLRGRDVEEIRLTPGYIARCADSLSRVLTPMAVDHYEAKYTRDQYNTLKYPIEHALPYLVDQLVTLPHGAKVAYSGGSRAAFDQIRRAWQALGFTNPLLVSRKTARFLGVDAEDGVVVADMADAVHAADAFLFEFGIDSEARFDQRPWLEAIERAAPNSDEQTAAYGRLSRQRLVELDEDSKSRLAVLLAEFLYATRAERRAVVEDRRTPRKFYTINAVHNLFEWIVADEIAITWAPFTLRLRHGYVRTAPRRAIPDPQRAEAQAHMTAVLRRGQLVEPWEIDMAASDLRHILNSSDPSRIEPWRFNETLLAFATWPGAAAWLATSPEQLEAVASQVPLRRLAASLRPEVRIPAPPMEGRSLSKLCASEDWEDPAWGDEAIVLTRDALLIFSASGANYFKRSRGMWERTQYLHGFTALGVLTPNARAAVLSPVVDGFYLHLSGRLGSVDAVDLRATPPADAGADPWLAKSRLRDSSALTIHHDGLNASVLAGRRYDMMVVTQNGLFASGTADPTQILAWMDEHLALGGAVAFSVEVSLNGATLPGLLRPDQLDALLHALDRLTGWRVEGPFDWSLSDATLDRTAESGTDEIRRPHLVRRSSGVLHTVAVVFCRKEASTEPSRWTEVRLAAGVPPALVEGGAPA